MSDSMRPQTRQPTRLCRPWDSPGKNTGMGCHFLLQCMKVKSQSEVAQSCPTLIDPMNYSLPGSSVHGSFQARVLEWGAIAFSLLYTYIHTKKKPTKTLFSDVKVLWKWMKWLTNSDYMFVMCILACGMLQNMTNKISDRINLIIPGKS